MRVHDCRGSGVQAEWNPSQQHAQVPIHADPCTMQLDRMAQLGLCHQDLNLNNIMVVSSVPTKAFSWAHAVQFEA